MKKTQNEIPLEPNAVKNQAEQEWSASMKRWDSELDKTHVRKEFSFTATEKKQLQEMLLVKTIAERFPDTKLNMEVLPRVGIQLSPENKVLYSTEVGKFAVWIPKTPKTK